MALDQGTTSSRCILFDKKGNICSMAQKEFAQIYPNPGWVEHNPMEIWSSQLGVVTEALAKIGADAEEVATVGYGYKTGSSTGLHPFNTPSTTVGTFVKYSEKNNELGTYTGDNSKTRQVGSWYHDEYTFTPSGLAELDFSTEGTIDAPQKAPFLVFYMKEYSGTSIFIDNVKVQSQLVGTINPMGGTVSDTSFKGFVGEHENITPPTRFGYDFAGWYTDGALKNKFDGVFTADLHGSYLYAGWDNTKIGIRRIL
jgi:uncharacterized repeat protein (TIGR02543 family)